MALIIGEEEATTGIAKAIFEKIRELIIQPSLDELLKKLPDEMKEEVKKQFENTIEKSLQKLSYAVSFGIVSHLCRDLPEVNPNKTQYGETFSSSAEDDAFWKWLADFVGIFDQWSNGPIDGALSLQTNLQNFFKDNPVPKELKGIIK